ncbi:syndecan-2 isoform X1 [Haplochromis burtoni]|uniref:Syndecan n=1 Tax=Haplochromis burtoni TaxID=8153 RepID=A0A3Q2VHU1_HAPBU|nr:syndecan-2 isoform X1 [Haplochromis burtoni]
MGNLWWLFLVGLATGPISGKLFVFSQSFSPSDDLYIEGRTSGDLPIDDEDGDDGGSGSGSGDYVSHAHSDAGDMVLTLPSPSSKTEQRQPQPTVHSPDNPPTTVARSHDPATTAKETDIFPDGDKGLGVGPTADWFGKDASPSTTNVPPSGSTRADGVINSGKERRLDVLNPQYEEPIKKSDETLNKADREGLFGENSMEVSSENLLERKEVLAAVIVCGVIGFLCAVSLLSLLAYRMKKKDEGSYDLGDNKLSATAYHKAPTKEFYA